MQMPAHIDVSEASKLVENELEQVRQLIERKLCSNDASVNQLLSTFGSCSGKMLRPRLVLLSGCCCGKITEEHIRVAAIVEMIHNATLLHDDVIDEGQKRRGMPTVNSLKGNETAILLGDFQLSQVFRMCVNLDTSINKIIADVTFQTCQGELIQVTQRQNWQLTESEYIEIITKKSAMLFSCSCLLGALLAGADQGQADALARFGHNAGIAFQITDDLLDIIGDETSTGKTLGTDFDKNKLTLPVIHLLSMADDEEKEKIKAMLNSAEENSEILAEMLTRFGSLEYTRSKGQQFVEKAIASLNNLEDSKIKNALVETAMFVAGRVL